VAAPAETKNGPADDGIQTAVKLSQSFRSIAEALRPSVTEVVSVKSHLPLAESWRCFPIRHLLFSVTRQVARQSPAPMSV
jgi:hypothetical protein